MTRERTPAASAAARLLGRVAATVSITMVGAIAAFTGVNAASPGDQDREPVVHTVVIEATSFRPAVLEVRPGDTVVWRNDDMFPHTATSSEAGFDSGAIAPGASWRYTIGHEPGEVSYVCTYHPTMKGRLTPPRERKPS